MVDQAGEGGHGHHDKDPGDDMVVEENLPSMVSSFRKMSSGQMLTAWLGLRIVVATGGDQQVESLGEQNIKTLPMQGGEKNININFRRRRI